MVDTSLIENFMYQNFNIPSTQMWYAIAGAIMASAIIFFFMKIIFDTILGDKNSEYNSLTTGVSLVFSIAAIIYILYSGMWAVLATSMWIFVLMGLLVIFFVFGRLVKRHISGKGKHEPPEGGDHNPGEGTGEGPGEGTGGGHNPGEGPGGDGDWEDKDCAEIEKLAIKWYDNLITFLGMSLKRINKIKRLKKNRDALVDLVSRHGVETILFEPLGVRYYRIFLKIEKKLLKCGNREAAEVVRETLGQISKVTSYLYRYLDNARPETYIKNLRHLRGEVIQLRKSFNKTIKH